MPQRQRSAAFTPYVYRERAVCYVELPLCAESHMESPPLQDGLDGGYARPVTCARVRAYSYAIRCARDVNRQFSYGCHLSAVPPQLTGFTAPPPLRHGCALYTRLSQPACYAGAATSLRCRRRFSVTLRFADYFDDAA